MSAPRPIERIDMQLLILPPPPRVVQLPEDLLGLVLGHLEHFRDVAAARAVCRTWRDIIDVSSALWRKLIFGLPRRMPEKRGDLVSKSRAMRQCSSAGKLTQHKSTSACSQRAKRVHLCPNSLRASD